MRREWKGSTMKLEEISCKAAALQWGVSERSVQRWAKNGKIKSRNVGGAVRILWPQPAPDFSRS